MNFFNATASSNNYNLAACSAVMRTEINDFKGPLKEMARILVLETSMKFSSIFILILILNLDKSMV